jgi:hypothetical protein
LQSNCKLYEAKLISLHLTFFLLSKKKASPFEDGAVASPKARRTVNAYIHFFASEKSVWLRQTVLRSNTSTVQPLRRWGGSPASRDVQTANCKLQAVYRRKKISSFPSGRCGASYVRREEEGNIQC